MCGIVGIAGKITHQAKNVVFKDFLDVCQVRGRDSTGVIKVRNDANQSYTWVKSVGTPTNLFDFRKYESEIERGDAVALVGHCRHKTSGEVSVKNAHPFDFPDEGIIGVHNGTLRSYHNLEGYTYRKVDSEVLYEHLSKNGPKDTFEKVKGAYACVWWNDNDSTLNFFRNEERPLWFTWSKDMEMMFWASEIWMFAVVERKIELWSGTDDKGKDKYLALPVHKLWSFTINPKAGKDDRILTMKPVKIIEPAKEPVRQVVGYGPNYRSASYDDGDWVRDPDTQVWMPAEEAKKKAALTGSAGGEVPNPFTVGKKEKNGPPNDELNDDLPFTLLLPNLPAIIGNQEESGSTKIGNVAFMKNFVPSLDLLTVSKNSPKFPKNILSQRGTNTNSSRPNSRKKLSLVSNATPEKQGCVLTEIQKRKESRSPTSVRKVKGVGWFINDNFKEIEYSLEEFDKNTGSVCCHCKEPIGDLLEVHEFIDKNNFVCMSCVTPAKDYSVM